MTKKIFVSITEAEENDKRIDTISTILADGFFDYLKKKGHLRKDPKRSFEIEKVLDESRKICQGLPGIE